MFLLLGDEECSKIGIVYMKLICGVFSGVNVFLIDLVMYCVVRDFQQGCYVGNLMGGRMWIYYVYIGKFCKSGL